MDKVTCVQIFKKVFINDNSNFTINRNIDKSFISNKFVKLLNIKIILPHGFLPWSELMH